MPHRQGIIVFVKNPVLGKVKTRLAKTIGDEKALAIYHQLLQITHDAVIGLPFRKFVFYSDFVENEDIWENISFNKDIQRGEDLGERMQHAFDLVLKEPMIERAIIIGSDCPQISPQLITKAFVALETHEVVIGPAQDGGYYLLGMKHVQAHLFQNKTWSSSQLLTETIEELNSLKKTVYFLPLLSDLDEEKDLYLLDNLHDRKYNHTNL